MTNNEKAVRILQKALQEKEDIDSGKNPEGTRTDCHNILFNAVKEALAELLNPTADA